MTTTLISFLGLGKADPPHYGEAQYEFEGNRANPTRLVSRALIELTKPTHVIFFGTTEVQARWIETGLLAGQLNTSAFVFKLIPNALNSKQQQELLGQLVETLNEHRDADTIYVDVTHGFRIQPLIGVSAVAFVQSEWGRESRSKTPDIRIVYGAFDAKTDGVAPIWDLTELLTMHRWNAAFDALMRYGRADDLRELTKVRSEARRRSDQAAGLAGVQLSTSTTLRKLGEAASSFADDLALGRLHHLFTRSAGCLNALLRSGAIAQWALDLPLLRQPVDDLKRLTEGLTSTNVLDKKGTRTMAKLAQHYGRLQRFAEQAATIREAAYTLVGQRAGLSSIEPNTVGCSDLRGAVDQQANKVAARKEKTGDLDIDKLVAAVSNLRNDIEHLGIRDQPLLAKALRDQLAELSTVLMKVTPPFDEP